MLLSKLHLGRLLLLLLLVAGGPLSGLEDHLVLNAQSRDDLGTRIKAALKADSELQEFSIVPLVVSGTVTLYGAVDFKAQQVHAEEVVAAFEGVSKVVNKVVVLKPEQETEDIVDKTAEATEVKDPVDSEALENEKDIRDEDRGRDNEVSQAATRNSRNVNIPEFHVAKPGENISDIAKKYGISSRDIRRRNGMGISQQPVAFQKLMLNGIVQELASEEEVADPEPARTAANESADLEKENAREEEGAVVLEVLGQDRPKIKQTEPQELRKENTPKQNSSRESSRPDTPQVREELVRQDDSRPLSDPETIERNNWVFHRVANDEKDYEIADHYNVSLAELRERNGLKPGASLRKGSLIRIKKIISR